MSEPPRSPAPELADRAAYFPDADALVCADLHLGRDAASNVELPLGERRRLPDRIDALLERFEPAELVLAGDVLHSFDRVPDPVVEAFDAVRDAAVQADADLVLVEGNHDAMLDSIALEPVRDAYRLGENGDVLVRHGDEPPTEDAALYVIGHDHPAIEIEGRRRPCYLRGPAAGAATEVLVLPAFNALAPGTTVNGARGTDLQSPLVGALDEYRPAVCDPETDEALWFPPLGEFRRLL